MKIQEVLDSLPQIEFTNPIRTSTDEKLNHMGVPQVRKPDIDLLPYPDDVTQVSDEKLGHLLTSYMAWTGYLEYLMVTREADILLVKNAISRTVKDQVGSKGMKKADAERHETIIALDGIVAELEIQYKTVESRHRFYDACSKALSRELTRRTARYNS